MKWIDFIFVKVFIENFLFVLKVLWIGYCIIVFRFMVDFIMDFEILLVLVYME